MLSKNYGLLERTLHRLVLANPRIQRALADVESDLYQAQFKTIETDREVFVTGLPRAGTTLLLELLYSTGEFVTFTYRHMPLIMAPVLWSKLTGSFQKTTMAQERAHGDGMQVSVDSPEAFEEILWLNYLRDRIEQTSTLSTLDASVDTGDFPLALRNSIRKLLLLENDPGPKKEGKRYLSKNNANISRLDLLKKMFPNATVLVPFRHPLTHIESLSRQHSLFLAHHKSDRFSRDYMKWLGHYEFGYNFKPINFNNWLGSTNTLHPESVDYSFWLSYWIAAYSYVLEHLNTSIVLIDFDDMLENPERQLGNINRHLGLREPDRLLQMAGTLRSPTSQAADSNQLPAQLLQEAMDLYAKLKCLSDES